MVRKQRPSRSARDVAAICAARGMHPRYAGIAPEGLPGELDAILRASGSLSRAVRRLVRARWMQHVIDLEERLALPGLSAHLLARKRFVESEVLAALDDGARQVVVVGAGYDLVAARALRRDPELVAIEVDHPPTQARKLRAYATWQGPRPTLVPLDLERADLAGALEGCPQFRRGARSVFVAEGLVMYLAEADVLALLSNFAALVGPGSRLILSTCDADEHGRARLGRMPGLMRAVARLVGEPLRWGIRSEDWSEFAARAELTVHRQPSRVELEEELLPRRDHRLLTLGLEPFVVLATGERAGGEA